MTIVPESAAGQVTAFIKQGIWNGDLMPGQRLGEKELSTQCGVGRSSVREALRALVAEGVVSLEMHRGATIRSFTREEVLAQHRIREVLEGLAASLAATRITTSPHREEFLAIQGRLADAAEVGDSDTYLKLNYRFHDLIILIGNNPTIQEHVDRTRATQIRLQSARFKTPDGMKRSVQEHEQIVDAILTCDPKRAEDAMRYHIRTTLRTLAEMPDAMFVPASAIDPTEEVDGEHRQWLWQSVFP